MKPTERRLAELISSLGYTRRKNTFYRKEDSGYGYGFILERDSIGFQITCFVEYDLISRIRRGIFPIKKYGKSSKFAYYSLASWLAEEVSGVSFSQFSLLLFSCKFDEDSFIRMIDIVGDKISAATSDHQAFFDFLMKNQHFGCESDVTCLIMVRLGLVKSSKELEDLFQRQIPSDTLDKVSKLF